MFMLCLEERNALHYRGPRARRLLALPAPAPLSRGGHPRFKTNSA